MVVLCNGRPIRLLHAAECHGNLCGHKVRSAVLLMMSLEANTSKPHHISTIDKQMHTKVQCNVQ